jgi:hypothetical protein
MGGPKARERLLGRVLEYLEYPPSGNRFPHRRGAALFCRGGRAVLSGRLSGGFNSRSQAPAWDAPSPGPAPHILALGLWSSLSLAALLLVVRRIAPSYLNPWLALAFPRAFMKELFLGRQETFRIVNRGRPAVRAREEATQ